MRGIFTRAALAASLAFGSLAAAATGARAADLLDTIKQTHEVTVGTSNDPPLSYIDSKTNEGAGFMMDVLREFLKREQLDAKVVVTAMPFASLIPSVQSGRIQLMGDAMYIRPARQEVIDFTTGVFFNPESLDVPKGNPKKLHKLADLCGHSAGTYQGTVYAEMLKKLAASCPAGSALDLKTYPTIQNVFADLAAGRLDAGIVDSALSAYAIAQTPSLGFELVSDYVPEDKATTFCAFAVQKGSSPKFLAAFNKDWEAMKADGTAAKLLEKSGLTPADFFLKP